VPNQKLELGATFAGRYKITAALSQGGMGAVYEATHLETERAVALKVMLPELVPSEELRERFRKEARAAGRIDSDFVVGVLDAGVDAERGMPFLVMELLRGEDLGARVDRDGALPVTRVLNYLWQTSLALEAAHELGIVHRDLKPENLFLATRRDGSARIKVLDFGVAKFLSGDTTSTGVVGTLMYMAPEQVRVPTRVSAATDLHALAMVAFTLLVGRPYWDDEFRAAGMVGVVQRVTTGKLPEPASTRAARCGCQLPAAFDAWFDRATAQEPAQRFDGAVAQTRALARALGLSLPSERDSRRPPPAPADVVPPTVAMRPVARAGGNSRSLVAASLGVALLGVTVVVLGAVTLVPPSNRAEPAAVPALRRVGRTVVPRGLALSPVAPAESAEAPVSIDSLPVEGAGSTAPRAVASASATKPLGSSDDAIDLEEDDEDLAPNPHPAPPTVPYSNPYAAPEGPAVSPQSAGRDDVGLHE